jgi:Holliday junction resolvase-like predicted endonuclease
VFVIPIKLTSHEEYIKRVKDVHGDKYEVCSQYIGSDKIIHAKCKIHGSFSKSEARGLLRYGCPECGKAKQLEISKSNRKETGGMYEKHKYGKASEYFVAYHLTNLGYDVVMVTGNPRYDMIIESDYGRLFVQVKSGIKNNNDELKVNLRGNDNTKRYTSREIDLIAIHERNENKVYFVPIGEIEGKVSIVLRYSQTQRTYAKTKYAENYLQFNEEWFRNIHNNLVV